MAHQLEVIGNVASFAAVMGARGLAHAPWWQNGTLRPRATFDAPQTVEALMRAAGAVFPVEGRAVFLADGRAVEDAQGVVRADTGAILGAVGGAWTPSDALAPVDALRILQGLPEGEEPLAVTAGVMDGGRRLFVQGPAQPEILDDGAQGVEVRFFYLTSHGVGSDRFGGSMTAIVCSNTERVAAGESNRNGLTRSVRHTANGRAIGLERAAEVRATLDAAREHVARVKAAREVPVTRDEAREVARVLIPNQDQDGAPTSMAREAHETIVQGAFGRARGVDSGHIPAGSLAGLWAAVTEFADRGLRTRGDKASAYLRSSFGLDPRAEKIRAEGARLVLGAP